MKGVSPPAPRSRWIVVVAAVVLAGALAGYWRFHRRSAPPPPPPEARVVTRDMSRVAFEGPDGLSVEANGETAQGAARRFSGAVLVLLGPLKLTCDQLDVVASSSGTGVDLRGTGSVRVDGLLACPSGVSADEVSLRPGAGTLTLGGDVRLGRPDGDQKFRAATLTLAGELREGRTLLDEFAALPDGARKAALVPRLTSIYADDELTPKARYMLALCLLRPHLTWHAPAAHVPRAQGEGPLRRQPRWPGAPRGREADGWSWESAHSGEEWMWTDVPAEVQARREEEARNAAQACAQEKLPAPEKPTLFAWRVQDFGHPDVVRALLLLRAVGQNDEVKAKAEHWVAELEHNNTILTCDVLGGYAKGQAAPVVLDVCNAERLDFRLYRVQVPRDLLWVARRIGRDFIFRDHALGGAAGLPGISFGAAAANVLEPAGEGAEPVAANLPDPAFPANAPVSEWSSAVADLPPLDVEPRERWLEAGGTEGPDAGAAEAESRYFQDRDGRFRERLCKTYRPEWGTLSHWRCDRRAEVPAAALTEAGAYVLAVEANGQRIHVPLLVEPLGLALGRCRDGVLAVVSSPDGFAPERGAEIVTAGEQAPAVTDAEGVAFVRVVSGGDRTLVAHHEGRFAFGGFGQVFDGLYASAAEGPFAWPFRRTREPAGEPAEAAEPLAHVFPDGGVFAAYTDRPAYRAGQKVEFKLIMRLQRPGLPAGAAPRRFRDEDFDFGGSLDVPRAFLDLRFSAVGPNGHAVRGGMLRLNDCGTGAGSLVLPADCPPGLYSLRVLARGKERLLPDVFAVSDSRRARLELGMSGVPEQADRPAPLSLTLSARYSYGQPVAGEMLQVRLLGSDGGLTLARVEGALDASGRATLVLPVPESLPPGSYSVAASLRDEDGRASDLARPYRVGKAPEEQKTFAVLPRFLAVQEEFPVTTPAKEVLANEALHFPARDGRATLKFSEPGWYLLTAGEKVAWIFAYGGEKDPLSFLPFNRTPTVGGSELPSLPVPARHDWVNLSDYDEEGSGLPPVGGRADLLSQPALHLWALFDKREAEVGGKLRLLVYVPYERARLLFTLEARTILDYFQTTIAGRAGECYHVVEIPIRERHRPNFYLQGRILGAAPRGRAPAGLPASPRLSSLVNRAADGSQDPRWCRVDVVDPCETPAGERLRVTVTPAQGEYRPGERAAAQLAVTDLAGQPREAELSLSVVDESAFSLGEERLAGLPRALRGVPPTRRYLPKTWRCFDAQRVTAPAAVPAVAADILSRLAEQAGALKTSHAVLAPGAAKYLLRLDPADLDRCPAPAKLAGERPVRSLELPRLLREDFQETISWQPQLRAGADGLVQASFPLPESLTRYRLTAVGLTQSTELGSGRAGLRVARPLAVQLVLPRFAVEKDRLLAVGFVHNYALATGACEVSWEVTGAEVSRPTGGAGEWQVAQQEGTWQVRGAVVAPAGSAVRVALWLTCGQDAEVRVSLAASQGKESDTQKRRLPVRPLGRARVLTFNGTFEGQKELALPAQFIPRELQLSLSSSRLALTLDGLSALMDCPYGGTEQTLDRFLPALIAKCVLAGGELKLPPGVETRMQEVLTQNLVSLHRSQHADGGWGWWERDPTDPRMTVHVLHGLAYCMLAQAPVDRQLLERAIVWTKEQLLAGKLEPGTAARALLSLGLLTRITEDEFKAALDLPSLREAGPAVRVVTGLALLAVHEREMAQNLYKGLADWQPEDSEALAAKLYLQLGLQELRADSAATAEKLLDRRRGFEWEHTQATAAAIQSCASLLQEAKLGRSFTQLHAAFGRDVLIEEESEDGLVEPVYRAVRTAPAWRADAGGAVSLRAAGDKPVAYALRLAGTERMESLAPSGGEVKLSRRFERLDGTPLKPGEAVPAGSIFAVRLTLDLERAVEYVVVEDSLPAGCEYVDDRFQGGASRDLAHTEFHAERALAFFTRLPAGRHELRCHLRAETPGTSHVLPGCAYPMYQDTLRGETGISTIEVAP